MHYTKGFIKLAYSSHHQHIASWHWLGSQNMHLDVPNTTSCGKVIIGCYGGHTKAGADRNEDGALVWCADDETWEFAVLLDGHCSTESVELILATLEAEAIAIQSLLSQSVETAFSSLHQLLFSIFRSQSLRSRCRQVHGETSCLICFRKAQFLSWFCIGDCIIYLFHPELGQLEQFALNQRNFYEWIGETNSFDLPVACYTTGIRELRGGRNRIIMTTDGLLEGHSRSRLPQQMQEAFMQGHQKELEECILTALLHVHQQHGLDSATVIAWDYKNDAQVSYPNC